MSKLIKIGVLVLLVYLAITKLPPLLDKVTDMGSGLGRKSSSVSQSQCVSAAERASESFTDEMRNYSRPPIDLEAWSQSLESVRAHINEADARCNCDRSSCHRAAEALGELNGLIAEFDNSLRGDGVPMNPARRQETIDRLLKRAREFDRQGN